jgi:hypothetical protein
MTPYYCRLKGSTEGAWEIRCQDRLTAIRIFCGIHGVPVTSPYLVISTRPAKGIGYEDYARMKAHLG